MSLYNDKRVGDPVNELAATRKSERMYLRAHKSGKDI